MNEVTMLRCETLEPREVPAIWAASGADVFEVSAGGEVVRTFRPFLDATGIPVHLSTSPGVLFVGAGEGGAPRLSAFGMAGLTERWSVFVGDPNSRHGVNVATFDSSIRATGNATLPPSAAQLDREQAAVDRFDPALLPPTLVVEVFDGDRITELPEWAHLAGVPTPGHPGHTFDEALGATVPGKVWVAAGWGVVGHELGHVRHFWLGLALSPTEMEEFAGAFEFSGGIE